MRYIIIIIITGMMLPVTISAQVYDPDAAAAYAELWWNGRNPFYYDYTGEGGDCANFVSQCLIAGGLSLTAGTDGSGSGVDDWYCIPNCDNLHTHLMNYQNIRYERRSSGEPDWIVKGDAAIFGTAGGDYWRHAVFGVDDQADNTTLYNAHTEDVQHATVSRWYGTFNSCDFYHINIGQPVADFSTFNNLDQEPITIDVGESVQFVDFSSSASSWSWVFQGGEPFNSSEQNPVIVYNTPGVYNVSLTVYNAAGSDMELKNNFITVLPNTASISGNVRESGSGVQGVNMSFTGGETSVTTDINGYYNKILTIGWSGTMTPEKAGYTFDPASLVYSNINTDFTNQDFIATPNEPLHASFTATPQSGDAPLTVQFNSGQSTGNITSWEWDFNNNPATIESTAQNPTYNFTDPDTYTVQLTVSDGVTSNSITRTVTVNTPGQPPKADFTFEQLTYTYPFQIQFEDLSAGSPTSWDWSFTTGTPSSSTLQDPSVTYTISGTKSVTLTVYNAYGSDDITKDIFIEWDPPEILTANFTFENLDDYDGNIYSGQTLEFTDASTGGTVDCYTWTFIKPIASPEIVSGCSPMYAIELFSAGSPGTHTMELCVSNEDGEDCTSQSFNVQHFHNYDIYAQMSYIDGCACGRIYQEMGLEDHSYAEGPIIGMRIDWGDGKSDYYTSGELGYPPPDYPYVYHTYKNSGHYNFHYWIFGNGALNDNTWGGFNAVDCGRLVYSNNLGRAVYDGFGGIDRYFAGSFIAGGAGGNFAVRSIDNIVFNACNSIKLKTGFRTLPGAHFVATTSDPCLAWRPAKSRDIQRTAKEPTEEIHTEPNEQEDEFEYRVWNMLIYPNPNSGEFTILFSGDIEEILFVEVIDMLGKVIYKEFNVTTNVVEMDLSGNSKGMYIVRALVNGELVIQKVVIE